MLLVGLTDGGGRLLQGVHGTEEALVGLVAPAHVTRAAPPRGPQGVEAAVVPDAGVRIAFDRVPAQLRQVGPGVETARILRRDGGHGIPALRGGKGPRPHEGCSQLGGERLQHGFGAAGGELDGVVGGHRVMLGGGRAASTVRAVLSHDPRPTSFENHPGLRGREPEARQMADVLRRLIRLSVTTAPSPEETVRLTAELAAVADELEAHVPEHPLPRFIAPDEDGPPKDIPLGSAMPYDVVVGPFNPVAPPVVLDFDPPKALGRAVFDVTYEGAPGCVHGAILAATFDIVLTAANAIEGATGPTVRLALRYLRPTLTDEEAVFEGWVTEVTERRILSKGRIVQGGIVTVEADGEFAILNRDGVQRMADSRRATTTGVDAEADADGAVPMGE